MLPYGCVFGLVTYFSRFRDHLKGFDRADFYLRSLLQSYALAIFGVEAKLYENWLFLVKMGNFY